MQQCYEGSTSGNNMAWGLCDYALPSATAQALYFSQIGLWTTIQNSGSVPSATVHVPSATVQAATTAADAATPRIHMSRIHRNIKYGLSTLFL